MGRIAILPDAVADQIAAGEVVERPASVVKELVENALDAGATTIEIDLEAGGKTSITVSDDGAGMDRDDAVLAIDRHATSKITAASDLIGVATFGFRGEALPAIASISKFELETATASGGNGGSGDATRLTVDGGRLRDVQPTARTPGTTVRVRRLFFNAPARRKFLRTPATETRAATAAVSVLALMRLDVAFKLTSDGRTLVDAPRVSALGDRIESLFGRSVAEGLIAVEHHAGPVSVRGFIQRPAEAKPAGRKAFLFVNGRPFRDPFLVRAAEAGYRATIHQGSRPTVFLSLAVPGDAVDVNVHPTKLEVRFRDRRMVEAAVEEAVRHALGEMSAAAVVRPSGGPPGEVAETAPGYGAGAAGPAAAGGPTLFELGASSPSAPAGAAFEPPLEHLQVLNSYIVTPTADGVAIVDQHSAHERVLYEEAMSQLRGGGAPSQRLLLPITIDLEPGELEAVEEHRTALDAVGFEVEEFGGRSVVIHAVPNPHPRFDARRCFEELVADVARGRFGGWTNELERFAATFACRAAVKAGEPLESREISTLLRRLFACQLPPHDVHGRPTIVQLPREELERRFGRR